METAAAWSTITADAVRSVTFAFHQAHVECEAVHIERGRQSLVCWCERCRDLRAYEIDGGWYPTYGKAS